MVHPLLLQFGIPALANILSEALTGVDHPAAKGVSSALTQFQDALMNGVMDSEQIAEANRHVEAMAKIQADYSQDTLDMIQQTIRTEIASEDKFIRRMRPTFGYLMAVTWTAQMLALAYVIVFRTGEASLVLQAVESLSMIWTVGLSVLGVYVYKRSEDKKTVSASIPAMTAAIVKKSADGLTTDQTAKLAGEGGAARAVETMQLNE